jgi:valyl-tRNA synthetase
MSGFDVLLQPGVDHAGLQLQGVLDKKLSKEGINPRSLSREEYLQKAWEFKDQNHASVSQTFRKTGISADWSREVFTLDEGPRQAVFKEFKAYYDQGLLYKGPYIVNWCSKCGTAIEDIEMEYQERKERLYYINYQINDTDEYITVATARPETIFADTGIAVYPNHPKFAKFIGKQAINPLTGNLIPVFEDERVEKDFGTGALKITPGHDPLDYQIGKDHNLPVLRVIDKSGRLTEIAGDLTGLKVAEAREKTVEKLQAQGAIDKSEEYTHQVPICERCKTTVEPLISEEWFVRMQPLAEKAIKAIKDNRINFLPENYNDILTRWLENIHDWTISRSQVWGHRIPVWYKGDETKVSLDSPGESWAQDEQVLDTWFSSGLWPMSTLGWPKETPEFKRYYPWSLEVTAPEIKFLWIARMVMLGLWFTDKVPFTTMFFHGTLRDLKGQKFSKSLGNGIDPIRLFDTWGVDATRMALISYSIPGRDARTSNQTVDERAKNYRNFATKLWNIARFILSYQEELSQSHNDSPEPSIQRPASSSNPSSPSNPSSHTANKDDIAIVESLKTTIVTVTRHLDNLELHLAAETLYEFIWHQFADIYIEQTKTRRSEAQPTLEYIMSTSLQLLHPFMPFVTEEIWSQLPETQTQGQPLIISAWPKQK